MRVDNILEGDIMKKLASMLLVVAIMCGLYIASPLNVYAQNADIAETSLSCMGFGYKILEDGTAEVTCYDPPVTDMVIPSSLDGYTVTSIGDGMIDGKSGLTSLVIPDTVKRIGDSAFESCYELTTVTLPDSLTTIGEDAFRSCESLKDVVIPDSVTSLGNGAFSGCYSLVEVEIPDSITDFGDAFSYCKGLEKRKHHDYSGDEFRFAKQFASADTIVIAAPFWDLSFPAVVKIYFENITVSGITFEYSKEGRPTGKCQAKKLYYVTTAGGYIEKNNFGFEYVKAIAENFFGINDVRFFAAEGLDIFGADIQAIMDEAKKQIADLS